MKEHSLLNILNQSLHSITYYMFYFSLSFVSYPLTM